jgi:hypothetical protein
MGDGADWIWNTSQEQFPGATEIVDLYHARQHLWDLGAALHPREEAVRRRWIMKHQPLLDEGKVEKLVAALRALRPKDPKLAQQVRTEANYFESNAERMLSALPPSRPICGDRGRRGRMQNGHRHPLEALGHVLDGTRRQCDHSPSAAAA